MEVSPSSTSFYLIRLTFDLRVIYNLTLDKRADTSSERSHFSECKSRSPYRHHTAPEYHLVPKSSVGGSWWEFYLPIVC